MRQVRQRLFVPRHSVHRAPVLGGMDAIGLDENGKARIDYDRCVSCGQCLVSCPFGAIVDKSQIFQVVRSIAEGNNVVAIVAPSFVGSSERT